MASAFFLIFFSSSEGLGIVEDRRSLLIFRRIYGNGFGLVKDKSGLFESLLTVLIILNNN